MSHSLRCVFVVADHTCVHMFTDESRIFLGSFLNRTNQQIISTIWYEWNVFFKVIFNWIRPIHNISLHFPYQFLSRFLDPGIRVIYLPTCELLRKTANVEAGLNYWRQATFGLRRYVDMLAVAVTVLQHGEADVGEEKVVEVGWRIFKYEYTGDFFSYHLSTRI